MVNIFHKLDELNSPLHGFDENTLTAFTKETRCQKIVHYHYFNLLQEVSDINFKKSVDYSKNFKKSFMGQRAKKFRDHCLKHWGSREE